MKNKQGKRLSKKMLLATLIVPVAMCLVIVVALAINFVQALMGGAIQDAESAARISSYNSQELVFSLLGVAMTVWVGLNIYNVLSREELNQLLETANNASKITEDTYTQVLISKLRLLPADRFENYLANRLQMLERLPFKILEQMILLEDKFNYAYALYIAGTAGQTMKDGLELVEDLETQVEMHENARLLSRTQHDFLAGYLALRQAELSFFLAQYDEVEGKKVVENHGREILAHYYTALHKLFGVKPLSHCKNLSNCTTEDYQGLAIMANNICSVYIVLIKRENLDSGDLDTAIEAGEIAAKFGAEVQPHIKAIFARNLGVAYEWKGDMENAIRAYYQAYKFDRSCPKVLHCIASWHRKWFCEKYPFLDPNQNPNQFCITTGDFAGAAELFETTTFWYWLEQISNGGFLYGWPFDLPKYVQRLAENGILVDQTLPRIIENGRYHFDALHQTATNYQLWKASLIKAGARL